MCSSYSDMYIISLIFYHCNCCATLFTMNKGLIDLARAIENINKNMQK